MALKAKIKNLEEVDEQFRGLYVQVKDGYELSVEGADTHSAYSTITGQLQTLKDKFKDVDPAKYAELVAAENEYKQLQAKIEEAKASVTTQLTKQFDTEKTKLTGEVKELEAALHEALVVQAATAAISKVAPDSVDLLLPHVTAMMKINKTKDGKRIAQIVDDKGQPRVINTKDGVVDLPIWADEVEGEEPRPSLLREMRENKKFMGAFPASDKGGGGAQAETGANAAAALGGGGGKTVQVKRSASFDEYRRAREQATKDGATVQLVD